MRHEPDGPWKPEMRAEVLRINCEMSSPGPGDKTSSYVAGACKRRGHDGKYDHEELVRLQQKGD